MIEKKKIEKKITKLKKKIKKQVEKEKLDSTQILQTQILKDGDNFTINWESKKLKLYIWDANKEDGDKIQLKINSNIILNDYETKHKRKRVKCKLQEGENTIEITALSLGNSSPNTSRIELVDSKIKYPIITQLELGKSVIIKVVK